MPNRFATKAQTLALLQGQVTRARIAPLAYVTVAAWQSRRLEGLATLRAAMAEAPWPADAWIVRSSCRREDAGDRSNAGAFRSIADVAAADLAQAIDLVIASYGEADGGDEVLVQPMLRDVLRSGVAFSHDPHTCSPYRVVNWADGADTTLVTGGRGGRSWQQAARSALAPPGELVGVLALVEELLALFGGIPIDCEFAVTREHGAETLWLLQARPLMLARPPEAEDAQAERLQRIHDAVGHGMQRHPMLPGRSTAYGVMPDWNPAEVVGLRPGPLAQSLYRDLITDAVWARQRHDYGYRDLRGFPLMPHFCGLPYIDVRLSFNSFVPADLDDRLAGRLVDHYLDHLRDEPTLHDKVEFDIVLSCYTLDMPQRLARLAEAGFTADDRTRIAESLRRLTNRIVHPRDGYWRADAAKLDILKGRREVLRASTAAPLEQVYGLLEDARCYGTLPFAGLARAAFIAVQMLQSMRTVGILSPAAYDAFIGGVSTVSGQLTRDRASLDPAAFLARYGHLRPGAYNILSPRYDEAPDLYFDWDQPSGPTPPMAAFSMTPVQMRKTAEQLGAHGLPDDPAAFLAFLKSAIELRELAKFHFTHNLSDALVLIAGIGARWGFSREDMAYCDIGAIRALHRSGADPVSTLRASMDQGRARHAEALATALPPLILRPDDVWGFEWPDSVPNFITQRQATGLVTTGDRRSDLAGAIVCIPSADPGFDWLFAHPIAGLITAWGGANSHMAIRAGELGLPAVIGGGEALYRLWSGARRLRVDCAARVVEVLA